MQSYYLTVHLRSDATFGRGEGLAGFVDVEIEHDEYGCPIIGARSMKGLLVEEWANLRFALGAKGAEWDTTAALLFGGSGANESAATEAAQSIGAARLHFGPATLPPDLCIALRADTHMTPTHILASLTAVRRQTSMDVATGAPQTASLRSARVLLRDTQLIARLDVDTMDNLPKQALGLLSACVLAVRRGGTARNRGRGRLNLLLHDHEPENYDEVGFTQECFKHFVKQVQS